MKTKFHVRFFNRASHLDADIELADVIKILSNKNQLSTSNNGYIFDSVNKKQHPTLSVRKSNLGARTSAIHHLKSTLCEAFIKNIYENLIIYLSEVLTAAAQNGLDPDRLIGEHKVNFEANDILKAGSWENVVSMVSNSVFRKLENERKTSKLLEKLNDKLNLKVQQSSIDNALPYLELRHLLVHNNGEIDDVFANKYPSFGYLTGDKIKLDYDLLQKVRKSIYKLVNEFDKQIVDLNVISPNDLQS